MSKYLKAIERRVFDDEIERAIKEKKEARALYPIEERMIEILKDIKRQLSNPPPAPQVTVHPPEVNVPEVKVTIPPIEVPEAKITVNVPPLEIPPIEAPEVYVTAPDETNIYNQYQLANSDQEDEYLQYHGYVKQDGAWFIAYINEDKESKQTIYRYASGKNKYDSNWNNRYKLKYSPFNEANL